MRYQRISAADKERLVNAHTRGDDYVDLARQLGIKRTTAYAIIRRAAANDGIVALPRGGIRPQRRRVTPELCEAAVSIVESHPKFTLEQIYSELRATLPTHAHISISTLSSMLHGQLIVMKKLEDAPAQRNTDEVKQQRREFAEWITQNNQEMIFIDEAGLNLWTKRTRGRARVGERAVRIVGGTRSRNFTMVFAVSPASGMIHHQLQSGGMNGERCNQFLTALADVLPNNGAERVFLFDNAPAHRQAGNVEFPASKRITLKWLPPYSPMLDIVEQCFAQWKAQVKRNLAEVRYQLHQQSTAEREATLCQIAEQSIAVITSENTAAYLRHLYRYIPACLLQQDISM